jgi:hypothetical protein
MPYVAHKDREVVDGPLDALVENLKKYDIEDREGMLNYCMTRLTSRTMRPETGWRYKYLNRAIGVIESVKQEFYRRLVGPYEEKAIFKNGDIPEYEEP